MSTCPCQKKNGGILTGFSSSSCPSVFCQPRSLHLKTRLKTPPLPTSDLPISCPSPAMTSTRYTCGRLVVVLVPFQMPKVSIISTRTSIRHLLKRSSAVLNPALHYHSVKEERRCMSIPRAAGVGAAFATSNATVQSTCECLHHPDQNHPSIWKCRYKTD